MKKRPWKGFLSRKVSLNVFFLVKSAIDFFYRTPPKGHLFIQKISRALDVLKKYSIQKKILKSIRVIEVFWEFLSLENFWKDWYAYLWRTYGRYPIKFLYKLGFCMKKKLWESPYLGKSLWNVFFLEKLHAWSFKEHFIKVPKSFFY